MKRKYIMVSLLIPGPQQPGNDIDVYIAPLVEDLRKMWDEGVSMIDAHADEEFPYVQCFYAPLMIFRHMEIIRV